METENTTAAEEQDVEKSEDAVSSLKARITDLEKQLADAKKPDGDGDDVSKSVDPTEEFLKSAPPAVTAMIETMRKQAQDAETALQKNLDAQADEKAIEKAKAWKNLNLDAEKMGPALRKLGGTDSDLLKSIETAFDSLNAQAESANIFAELGKSSSSSNGDTLGTVETMAKALVESGAYESMAKARVAVVTENPELYAEYQREKAGK